MARVAVCFFVCVLALPGQARAHCDTLDGPVVKAAARALATGNISFALAWVQERDEAQITAAFEKTLAVRELGADARTLADHYFYETLVRVHRAGEGEPYTGLKPAGLDHGPAIPAAEKAIERGSPEPVVDLLMSAIGTSVNEHLEAVLRAQKDAAAIGDVAAGRRLVMSYVRFIHLVEAIFEAATALPVSHHPEADEHGPEGPSEGGAL